jgi:glycosyltransferase involved in cell wall biosynthesis
MVLAGNHSNAYGSFVKSEIERRGLSHRIFLTGVVSDEEKCWLYKNCSAFVFPSVSEGFGIPVIEAMQFGKPVFCSLFGSLPEMGCTHSFFWKNFDPENMKDFFLEKVREFYSTDDSAVNSKQYANSFSWDKAAKGYLSFYEQLIK